MLLRTNLWVAVFLTVVCISEMHSLPGEKYKAGTQKTGPVPPSQWEFRQRRVNQVWEKAQRLGLSEERLAGLKRDLKAHDEKAMHWKKMKRDGGDPDGEKEAGLRRQLSEIMAKHGMPKMKFPEDKMMAGSHDPNDPREFQDLRLNKIWAQAMRSGSYNDEELRQLRRELNHHQDKVEEYKSLVDEVHGPNDINRVDKFQRLDVDEADKAKDRKIREIELKVKHKELNADYKKLEMKAIPEELRGGFEEPRVYQLWQEAMRANFTEDELASIQEELRHFEKKLQKQEDLKEQSLLAEMSYHSAKASGDHHDAQHHLNLREKLKDMSYKVKKYMADFNDRIGGRRQTEL